MTVCAPAAGPRRVLMIHSFGRDFAPFAAISSGFRTELAQQSPEPVEVQEASLETALFAEGQREETVVEYLRVLLGGRKPDLVVTFGAPAGGFWLRHREAVLPSTPALIAAMDQRRLPDVPLGADVTTVSFSLDLPGAVEHILRVVPGTTNITVALGASATEKYWEAEAKAAFQAFTNRLAFNWLNQLPLGEMQKRVASLPPRSAILYGGIALDANGVPYEQDRPLAALHAAANTPIFGFFDNLLGRGIVGGPLIPIQEMSQETARVAVRILGGESPGKIQTPPFGAVAPLYDWRELKRWGISETRLPSGSEVRFHVPTFWEQYKWRLITIHAVCLVEGLLIFLLLRNRRRLRRTQNELRQSKERLSLATTSAKVGVWSWNIASGDIEATAEAKHMFGWAADERVTFPMFLARLHPDDRTAVQQAVDRAVQTQTIYDTQYRICLPDGQTRWIAARGRAHYQNGSPVNLLGVLLDVTEREQAQAEAQRQRAELAHVARVSTMGELAASVAHELNQPLGAILSNAEAAEMFLNANPPAIQDVREILGDIRKDDERASEVIRRMRALLRKREMEMQPLDLNSVVEDVFRLVGGDAALRKTTLAAELSPRLPAVQGDRVHLQQVLLNLTMNAMEAMAKQPPEKRQLAVRTCVNGEGAVEVAVTDFGPGIEPDKLPHLFEPFFTTKPSGMGMGLSIARRIIEAHGGRISAENNASGGATFRVALPVGEGSGRGVQGSGGQNSRG